MSESPEGASGGLRPAYKVAMVAPTCFYYQVPLFRVLAANPRIEMKVYYCSEEALHGADVPTKFGTKGRWGVEDQLLDGYEYKFLRNVSPWPSYLKSVVGLMNFGIWKEIVEGKPHIVILMSWMNPTWWLAILACWYANVPFLYLTDQNVQRDLAGPWWKRSIKRLVLGRALFRLASGFLCAGTANQLLYQFYGVPDSKLVPFAFSWGFESLLQASQELKSKRNEIRAELGIPQESYVVLYCGRLSSEKSPMHLLQAYERVNQANKVLAIVGDGLLRQELQAYTAEKGLDSVHFFGFQDRHQIPRFYAIADVLVLPSDQETWGIVVNEAMCFGLPVIVSDGVGAARDLVRDGYNGLSFPRGDVPALTATIERLMGLPSEELSTMGERSRDLIVSWLKRDLAESLDRYFDHLHSKKARRGD